MLIWCSRNIFFSGFFDQ